MLTDEHLLKVSAQDLKKSRIEGDSWQEFENNHGGIKQRWLLVENQKRQASDQIKVLGKIDKEKEKATKNLNSLMKKKFTSYGVKQIINLTEKRKLILSFFSFSCQKYYFLSG